MRGTLVALVVSMLGLTSCDSSNVSLVKKAVAAEMKDPNTVEFRGVVERGHSVCGLVNGKNGFGTYAGFQRFFAIPSKPVLVRLEPDPADVSRETFLQEYSECIGKRQPELGVPAAS